MNGLDKIVQKISEDCTAAVASVISEAEAKAASIIADARAEAETERASLTEATDEKAAEIVKMAESSAALAGRRRILAERVAVVDGVIAHALESFVSGDPAAYFDGMKKLAVAYALDGEQRLVFSDADANRVPADFESEVNAAIAGKGKVTVCGGGKNNGGFMLVSDELVENCTLEALARDKDAELRDDLCRLLFS